MARFVVKRDVGILDRGEGTENRFVAVLGVEVDEKGSLSAESFQKVAGVMSLEAVKNGELNLSWWNLFGIAKELFRVIGIVRGG